MSLERPVKQTRTGETNVSFIFRSEIHCLPSQILYKMFLMILLCSRLAEITKTMEFMRVQMWYAVVLAVIFLKEEKDLHWV